MIVLPRQQHQGALFLEIVPDSKGYFKRHIFFKEFTA